MWKNCNNLGKTYKNNKSDDPTPIKGAPRILHSMDLQSWQKIKESASRNTLIKKNLKHRTSIWHLKKKIGIILNFFFKED